MSENSYEDYDEVLPAKPKAQLVHWMEPRPLTFGVAGLAIAVGGAFALGLATALFALGAGARRPERRLSLPLEQRLRQLH